MFNIVKESIKWGEDELTLETGKIARQADGAVIATMGKTSVLATVVYSKSVPTGIDFFPLTVVYQEKYYATGSFPGGFIKRENKPSEKEVLISRLIDRPIRPLFHERFQNEVQIIVTLLSADKPDNIDVLAMVAASAVTVMAGLPLLGTLGACRVGIIDGEYKLNPSVEDMENSSLDLVIAGTKEGILMVESEAKELPEDEMLGALDFGHSELKPIIDFIEEFSAKIGKEKVKVPEVSDEVIQFKDKLRTMVDGDLRLAFATVDKKTRSEMIAEIKEKTMEKLLQEGFEQEFLDTSFVKNFKNIEKDIVRTQILEENKRIDGRKLDEIRPIACEIDIFDRPHGSALFTRGETQAMVFIALGIGNDGQMTSDVFSEDRERFMLHYNFPGYSVGEVYPLRAPGRREIGHGKLAWRSLHPVMPSYNDFPYVVRSISEITESNGSSSMATVCGTSLALMAAGVPITRPVAGIAMGLLKEGDKFVVLSDILGDEDHLGDMDFKVAGSEQGITALQMDIKITSVTQEIMKQALEQAGKGREHILNQILKVIAEPRKETRDSAPRIESFDISVDSIREVIGQGGKSIRAISDDYGVSVDIADNGTVIVAGDSAKNVAEASELIKFIDKGPEIGQIYEAKVVKLVEFGFFVSINGKDGLVHISEIAKTRVENVEDYVKLDDIVKVKVIGIDDRGRIKLSMKF